MMHEPSEHLRPFYEVKVMVASLEEAAQLMKLLAANGYSNVSMSQSETRSARSLNAVGSSWARSSSAFGRFNELILASLYRAGADSKSKSVTIEQIVANLKELRGGQEMLEARGEGIISRTVSMVASAVLANKYGWVGYEDTEPRRYWLTESGLEHTGIISGEGMNKVVEERA
jgi:hypothetical protein